MLFVEGHSVPSTPQPESQNFGFLKPHGPLLVRLGGDAEHYFSRDPNTSLFKLRQLAEAIAQSAAASCGLFAEGDDIHFLDLIRALEDRGYINRDIAARFHLVRKAGNQAVHHFTARHALAMDVMKATWKLATWYHKAYGHKPNFKPGKFIEPKDPSENLRKLEAELAQLKSDAAEQKATAADAKALAKKESQRAEENEQLAKLYDQDRKAAEELATEAAAELQQHLAALKFVQTEAEKKPAAEIVAQREASTQAAQEMDLDEAETRRIIDQQLIDAGWQANTDELRYSCGTRPQKGENIAIAEWPTGSGPADYVLFVGMTPMAVVEAKRQSQNVAGTVPQAERYSRDYELKGGEELPEPTDHEGGFSGWAAGNGKFFRIPFVYATNGREYIKQIETESGIWFRDVRKETNLARALTARLTISKLGWVNSERRQDSGASAIEVIQLVGAGQREKPTISGWRSFRSGTN